MKRLKQTLSILLAATLSCSLLAGCFWDKPSSEPESSSSNSESASNVSWSDPEADTAYNAEDGKLAKDQYGSTVLQETEDAGQEYIDNTLFIGDSNTVRMMAYGHTTLENTIGTISMGIQHVPTKKCVYFEGRGSAVTIPEAVAIMQPQRIVITFGTNNTIGWSSEKFVEEYKNALQSITDAWPYADIIINAVPPVDKYRQNTGITMQTIDSFNKALAEMANELGYKFLDSSEALKDNQIGFAKEDFTYSDGVHLNKKAMEAFFNYFRTHSYITEDRRPKPLKKVPKRKETPPDIIKEDPLAVRGGAQKFESSSSSSSASRVPVVFMVDSASAGMGYLEGNFNQTVKIGDTCSTVRAVPSLGYEFDSWGCTVGRIADVYNSSLSFTVPGNAPKEGITVVAKFKKVICTCLVQCTNSAVNSNCKACTGGIWNCTAQPAATATPTPVSTPEPTPIPTAIPPSATPEPTPIAPTPTPPPTQVPPTETPPSTEVPATEPPPTTETNSPVA